MLMHPHTDFQLLDRHMEEAKTYLPQLADIESLTPELELMIKVFLRYKWDVPADLLNKRATDPRAWGEGIRLFDKATRQLIKGIKCACKSKGKSSAEAISHGELGVPEGKSRRVRRVWRMENGVVLPELVRREPDRKKSKRTNKEGQVSNEA